MSKFNFMFSLKEFYRINYGQILIASPRPPLHHWRGKWMGFHGYLLSGFTDRYGTPIG